MWEVVFLWMKKRGKSLPLWVLGLVGLVFLAHAALSILNSSVRDVRSVRTDSIIQLEPIPTDQPSHTPPPEPGVRSVRPPEKSSKDVQNAQAIVSESNQLMTHFTLGLEKRLQEDHQDPGLSRRLSERIYEGLQSEKMGTEDLRRAITEELGPDSSEENVDHIHQMVIQTLTEIADSPGPKPSPQG